jgi:hypothetical protein
MKLASRNYVLLDLENSSISSFARLRMLLTQPQPWWGSHHLHLPLITRASLLAGKQTIASNLSQPRELSLFTMDPPDLTGCPSGDLAPPTDNFYSPANFAFYSHQPYEPLDRSSHTIRLLAVTKDVSGQLQCTLRDGISLVDADDTYTAISYCAGDPKKTRSIMVNGLPFNAFANLAHAIEETYRYRVAKHGDVEVFLWTDQICINQSNTTERSHQVGFMGKIYSKAREVAVCLSTAEYSGGPAMPWIESVYPHVPTNPYDPNERKLLDFLLNACRTDDSFFYGWLAVLDMVQQPWWSRAWVRTR